MKKKYLIYSGSAIILITATVLLFSSSKNISNYSDIDTVPAINPDYSGVVIPPNIAPLNFLIEEEGKAFAVKLHAENGRPVKISGKKNKIHIPRKKWSRLLKLNVGNELHCEIFIKDNSGKWLKYSTIKNKISNEELDGYLAYRLIHPGYNLWDKMGLYQRNLQNFDEKPIMSNRTTDNNCMNCHAFRNNDGNTMMFHMRAKHGGTIIVKDGEVKKVDTKTANTMSAGVYPAWHPNGNLITFSVNEIHQYFHAQPEKRIEVMDHAADLILYDIDRNSVSIIEQASKPDAFETFPAWSPDGKYLYYCSALARSPNEYEEIKYNLLRIEFNTEDKSFGRVDTIVSSNETGLSVSFPRVSPDGRYVLFCMSDYGNFSIWHDESDLYIYDLEKEQISKPDAINSPESDSYHTWSSNGKWIVFSSRRINGLFTRPYFAYHYGEGQFSKPFLLPQKDPEFYKTYLKSYNVPELIKTPVSVSTWEFNQVAKEDAEKSSYEE